MGEWLANGNHWLIYVRCATSLDNGYPLYQSRMFRTGERAAPSPDFSDARRFGGPP